MKKTSYWLLKVMIAGFAAFLCTSAFCYFYYNLPAHEPSQSGATDDTWSAFHFSARGTEGFAYTTTDENGYVNTFPHKKDTVDILLMGSSHTEGFNVNADQSYAYLLNQKLYDNNSDMYAYNIGMSGHDIGRNLNNLENALQAFKPSRYVVIETHKANIPLPLMEQLLNNTYEPTSSTHAGIAYHLQKLDFLRLLYAQISNMGSNEKQKSSADMPENEAVSEYYTACLDQVLQRSSEIVQMYGCKLVILYSPTLSVDYSGNLMPEVISEELALLADTCEKYGIVFLNAGSTYEQMYRNTHQLPHGFVNTAVGTGHLNKYGHRCIADLLFDYVMKEES